MAHSHKEKAGLVFIESGWSFGTLHAVHAVQRITGFNTFPVVLVDKPENLIIRYDRSLKKSR